jgi:hypothetical protein
MEETRVYKVTFNEEKYNTEYTFRRCKSGASDYGNRTCVIVTREKDGYDEYYDTRYDSSVMKDFGAWCVDWMDNHFRKDLEPNWTEIDPA